MRLCSFKLPPDDDGLRYEITVEEAKQYKKETYFWEYEDAFIWLTNHRTYERCYNYLKHDFERWIIKI